MTGSWTKPVFLSAKLNLKTSKAATADTRERPASTEVETIVVEKARVQTSDLCYSGQQQRNQKDKRVSRKRLRAENPSLFIQKSQRESLYRDSSNNSRREAYGRQLRIPPSQKDRAMSNEARLARKTGN